jgi:hypothetical protein
VLGWMGLKTLTTTSANAMNRSFQNVYENCL